MSSSPEYTPPPPPPPTIFKVPAPATVVAPPPVASTGPDRAFLVELLIYNGAPFKDHWAYWVRSRDDPDVGVMLEAAGDVMNGFRFEINRALNFADATDIPFKRVPLQWVDGACFDEQAMLNGGQHKIDREPVCAFEASAHKIKAPGKTLNAVDDKVLAEKSVGKRISQRNCQTWIVEAADQLVSDEIFDKGVAGYLHAIRQ